MTVLQALSLAGGATDFGATNRISIRRTVSGQEREMKVELTTPVEAGDTIVVPERFF
jgi:polysaccharide export outer membrane protein